MYARHGINPYEAPGKWFKGNLHVHTTESDGCLSPVVVAKMYQEAGYHFLGISDHSKITDISYLESESFISLRCQEVSEGWPGVCEVLALNLKTPVFDCTSCGEKLERIAQEGALAVIPHPRLGGYLDLNLLFDRTDYLGIEIFNAFTSADGWHDCPDIWDALIASGRRVWGVAADDAHFKNERSGMGKGWIMVRAERLSSQDIVRSLRQGAFYATNGPEIKEIILDQFGLSVRCRPAKEIRFIWDGNAGQKVYRLPSGEIDAALFVRADWERVRIAVRIEVIDDKGKTAWSNPIFKTKDKAEG